MNIYAKLIDEDIDVWKPIEANQIDIDKFVVQINDIDTSLKKGDIVKVSKHTFADGTMGLVVKDILKRASSEDRRV